MSEIIKYQEPERAWNGKPVRATDEQIILILRPMFAMYPQAKVNEDMSDMYVKLLRDLDPITLADAVLKAMTTCKFLPTVAEIREHIEQRTPGPRSEVDLSSRRLPPAKMHRLDPDEDKRQRMERLRQTKGWRYA